MTEPKIPMTGSTMGETPRWHGVAFGFPTGALRRFLPLISAATESLAASYIR
jgi:hypothetical protein